MSEMTPKEILARYQEGMGSELGRDFHHCRQQYIGVTRVWDSYVTLFTNKDRVALLNQTIGQFVFLIQQQFIQGVAIGISRLLDPPLQGKRENLTLQRVSDACDEPVRTETNKMLSDILAGGEKLKFVRNKLLAHLDLEVATSGIDLEYGTVEEITALLTEMLNFFNAIDFRYLKQGTALLPLGNDGALRLLVSLHYFATAKEQLRQESKGEKISLKSLLSLPDFLSLTEVERKRYGV